MYQPPADRCVCVCVCVQTESEEKYDSIVAQPQGCVDVPPYNRDSAAGVTEDWDNGMLSLVMYFIDLCIATGALSAVN